jgi:Co/Zn/Cd efflux system component
MVLDALERWASAEAADVLGQLFIVAAIVLLVTAIPAWLMHGRGSRARRPVATEGVSAATGDSTADAEEGIAAGF